MMMKKVVGLALAVCLAAGFVFADAPASAIWIGAGDRTRVNDPANWRCLDAGGNELPGALPVASTTTVTVTGDTSFNCPVGQTPIWKTLTVSGTVNLTADCDWRGAGRLTNFINANTTINLKGHALYLLTPNGGMAKRINVTDDSPKGSGGAVHLDVPEGEEFQNQSTWGSDANFWFTGSLFLVKDGKGSFKFHYASSSTGFRYYAQTGGTIIHEGLAYFLNDSWQGADYKNEAFYAQNSTKRPYLGQYGATLTIDAGATLNYKGVYDMANYPIILNGGTLFNDRQYRTDWGTYGSVTLLADSTIGIDAISRVGGPINLGGHELTINIASGVTAAVAPSVISNGVVKVTGEGTFNSLVAFTATNNVTLDVASPLQVSQTINVDSYVARYTGDQNAGVAALNVYGTFTPVTTNFYPCTMQDGSRIDLSDVTGAWNLDGAFGALKFAPNAVVTIDVGARTLQQNEQVIKWTTFPLGVSFRIVGSAITTNLSPRMELDGLYYDLGEAGDVGVAHWTGAGRRSDFKDPANWACTNGMGEVILGALPGERTSVYFHSPFNFDITNAAILATYQTVNFDHEMVLSGDCDWSGCTVNEFFFDQASIDLAGHSMRLAGVNGDSTCTFTVTNSVEETLGSFIFDVPADATFLNSTILFQGAVTVVKDGPGTFLPHRYSQTYTGGTHIAAGTLQLYKGASGDYSPAKANFPLPLGVRTSATASHAVVTVDAGATYDINGLYDCCIYTVVLNGGTLTNAGDQPQYTYGGLGALTLQQDSTIVCDHSTVFTQSGSWWNLNGHTLFIETSNGARLYRSGISATNGTIVVTGDGVFDVHSNTFNAPGVTLDSASCICANGLIVVDNYVSHYTGKSLAGSQRIEVTKSFKPVTDSFSTVALREGAAIDVSERTNVFNVVGANNGQIIYPAETKNIVIDVGSRVLAPEEQLVAWSAIPEGITFTLRGENLQATDGIFLVENGIFFNLSTQSRTVMRASWTGAAGDDDFTNPANWSCQNAFRQTVQGGLPMACSFVTINGPCALDFPPDSPLPPYQKFTVESSSLTKDCDWRGLGTFNTFIAANSIIDLRGHKLTVSAPNATVATAMTFTDTTSNTNAPGELHCVAASGTFTNTGVSFMGNLRFVKEGAATFVPQHWKNSYTGGTIIAEGMIQLFNSAAADNSTYAASKANYVQPIGANNSLIVVKLGATLDINGVYDLQVYRYELAGGTIKNSKSQSKVDWGALSNVTLTTNSTISVNTSTVFYGGGAGFDLGGWTLSVPVASSNSLHFRGTYKNGTILMPSGGTLHPSANIDAPTVSLDINGALNITSTLTISNYVSRYSGTWNAGSAALNVKGKFVPVGESFFGCTLLNGATLDLTGKTDVWSTTAKFQTDSKGATNVLFEANASIKVDIGEREPEFSDNGLAKIVDWSIEPPPASTRFYPNAAVSAKGRRYSKRPDGLYLMRSGLAIFFH